MTAKNACWSCARFLVLLSFTLLAAKLNAAEPPMVSLLATDPHAAEEGRDPGSLTVIRTGPIGEPLTVHYIVGGSAENGVDYEILTGEVTIPANCSCAPINIHPIDDALVEGNESVLVGLVQPLILPPPYIVCWPSVGLVEIEDNDSSSNQPPRVALVNPPDGSVFQAPVDITLVARAADPDGRVRTVEFFAGNQSLGIVTNRPILLEPELLPVEDRILDLSREELPDVFPDLNDDFSTLSAAPDAIRIPGNLFRLLWENAPPGVHILTAVATDNRGASTTSEPVRIEILPPPPQPVVNVFATDPVATEPDSTGQRLDTATFKVVRSGGDPSVPLSVFYRIGGSARNGEDYSEIPHMVVIPAHERAAEILIEPLHDTLVEGAEDIVIALVPPVCIAIFPPPPDCFRIGDHRIARALIRDNDPANHAPEVRIVRPLDGSIFLAPADLRIVAQAADRDGRVVSVEFFANGESIGIVSNDPPHLDIHTPPFVLPWLSVPPGRYVLTAQATDDDGAQTLSRPVHIKVVESQHPPIVTVEATDPEASEGPTVSGGSPTPNVNTATFSVRRTGPTTRPLEVFYNLGGSAMNGVDYQQLSGRVTIPVGASAAPVVVTPIDDNLCEGTETVKLAIDPPVCIAIHPPPPECYRVGDPDSARAVIQDNDICPTNVPPKVAIVQPEEGDLFRAGSDIPVIAEAKDADGTVVSVEFFANGDSIGVVPGTSADQEHFRMLWQNVPAGAYELTAVAKDNRGATTRSDPVHIRVIGIIELPVVTIEATDPHATEGPIILSPGDIYPIGSIERLVELAPNTPSPTIIDTATFTVKRTGPTHLPLTVFYRLGGTASNGIDYEQLTGEVTIQIGAATARVVVVPKDDNLAEGTESVVAELEPVLCPAIHPPPPGCYRVGEPDRAVAYIRDNDPRNLLPRVEIVKPEDGETFPANSDIDIAVSARDPDGWVQTVEFFADGNKIGEDSIYFIVAPPPGQLQRFSMTWSNVPPGRYELTAKATDNRGAMSLSAPIVIKVLEPCRLPVITLTVPDPAAAETDDSQPPNTATFRICRSCVTPEPLTVLFDIGGSAENNVDYEFIRAHATIPAGQACVDVVVRPLDDLLVEGTETVEIKLSRPDCLAVDPPPAGCYLVGHNASGIAYIRDNDAPPNLPPAVSIISPPDGSTFLAPVDIRIVARASDGDGWVKTVEFFADGVSLGVVTNHPWVIDPIRLPEPVGVQPGGNQHIAPNPNPVPVPINPFFLVWSNVPPGAHVLTTVATDNRGASTQSDPIHIRVLPPPPDPIVTVIARDPIASEGCPNDPAADCVDTATFVVRRTGDTAGPLRVYYRLGGSASNGIDYVELPKSVVIPPGSSHAPVVVEPIDDTLVEGPEKVVISLVDPPCLDIEPADIALDENDATAIPPGCYQVGRAHTARAVIRDNDSPPNDPPFVRMLEPQDGDIFRAGSDIKLIAAAFDPDGQVAQVEFFEGSNSLGVVTMSRLEPLPLDAALAVDPSIRPLHPVFELLWEDVPAGRYVLTAVATDNDGASTISEPVEIKVVDPQDPPEVNIVAEDPIAREKNPLLDSLDDPAVFVVTRTGDTSRPLLVFYRVGGTADNGVDYELLRGHVQIEAGSARAEIVVNTIDDLLCEGRETVRIGLVPHPCIAAFPPVRDCYRVGPNSRARAVILDDDICPPNQPPRVAIVRPEEGDAFHAPADIEVCAKADDSDGRVVSVIFYANDQPIGAVRVPSPNSEPELFCIKWEDVPAGAYELVAVATDNEGASTRSAPVHIRVIERPHLPVVTLHATDPVASEDGAVGAFTVRRNCCTGWPLYVRYSLSGTASNGQDYQTLSGVVTIPTGEDEARIIVDPIDDNLVEGTETVVAKLEPALCMALGPLPVDCYRIGHPARDVVFIRDNDSTPNEPPLIGILSPIEGSTFPAPADIHILSVGLDPDGWITQVEFFANGNPIGGLAILVSEPPPNGELQTFEFDWTGVPPGNYTLTAKATDNRGAMTLSGPIHIRVVDPCHVPVVTVRATDPIAAESGHPPSDTATFAIQRNCGLTRPLLVHYVVRGTAANGVDYWTLSGQVLIPAGEDSAPIVVRPIDDEALEGVETVNVEIVQHPCLSIQPVPDGCYLVGDPGRAIAYIRDNENHRPRVAIVKPLDGEMFRAPANIEVSALALDPDGWVPRVEFFANGSSIGVAEIHFIVPPPPGQLQTFTIQWPNVAAGRYVLTAVATDDRGATTRSGPIEITVVDHDPIPVVNIMAIDPFAREGAGNTATFRVRRTGATDAPLTVFYSIHGTAENGVDYVSIPNSVTIPAGRRSARITITPIDDHQVEGIETVALRLIPAALYNVGRPARAAAIIVDNDHPHPPTCRLPDGLFHLCLPGDDGFSYRLEASVDLLDWEPVCYNTVTDEAVHYVDPDAPDMPQRFFRVIPDVQLPEED